MKKLLHCLMLLVLSSGFTSTAQWVLKPTGTFQTLNDIYFPNADTGYVAGNDGTLLRSVDAGETWSALSTPTIGNFHALHFFTGAQGWLAGDSGLFQTADAGNTWSRITTLANGGWHDIEFTDAQVGFLCGEDGVIARTPDRGLSWTLDTTQQSRTLVSLSFPTAQVGYASATGYNWEFLKTTDGGLTWSMDTIQPLANVGSLESIYFISETRGFIAGWYISTFVGTQDGGDSWQDLATAGPVDLYSIDFPDSQHGYACGWNMSICKTVDGGDTWTFDSIPGFGASLHAIRFLDAQTGFVVGDGGLLLKTTSGGTTSIADRASSAAGFFPNPVASGGMLRCLPSWLPEDARVELRDLRGALVFSREVSAAEREFQLPLLAQGTYTVRVLRGGETLHQELLMVR